MITNTIIDIIVVQAGYNGGYNGVVLDIAMGVKGGRFSYGNING